MQKVVLLETAETAQAAVSTAARGPFFAHVPLPAWAHIGLVPTNELSLIMSKDFKADSLLVLNLTAAWQLQERKKFESTLFRKTIADLAPLCAYKF